MIDYAGLMTKAFMLRTELGEDSNTPVDIFALAQNIEDLSIVYYPLGENLSGMCIKDPLGNRTIAINSGMTLGRQRFSLAHEFYHLFYDDSMVSVCAKMIGTGIEVERSADMFASYFLMPDAALQTRAANYVAKNTDRQLSLVDVIRIEQYFGVSHQAAVYRLMKTPYLKESRGDRFLNTPVRRTAESIGFSSDLYKPSPDSRKYMTYGDYIDKADKLLEKGLISNGKYEELLLDAFRNDLVYGDEEEGDVID